MNKGRMGVELNETSRWTLINALTVAKDRYALDAKELAAFPNHNRMAEDMVKLAADVQALADLLEQAAHIYIYS